MSKNSNRHEINLEFEGKQYFATYSIKNGVVKLNSEYGTLSTQIGGSTSEIIAKTLFREILQNAKPIGKQIN